jgi:coenzyme F420-reducing hydrogenase gamma subunit
MVATGAPCLGPVTQAGCGSLCPTHARGCYGCFGPAETPNSAALAARFTETGRDGREIYRLFHSFNANAPAFRGQGGSDG